MRNTIYKLCLAIIVLLAIPMANIYAQKTLQDARIYINPGHGGWGPNDRPLATINYAVKDTLGFFETKSNLMKAKGLYDELKKAGTGYIKMSRTVNGVVRDDDKHITPNDKYREGDVVDGVTQIVTLSVIAQDVETNNMDYFLSIHSNAFTDGAFTNYPLLLYRGTDAEVGNGLVDAKNMALDAWKYISKNDITYYSAHNRPTSNNTRGDISFMGGSSTTMGYTGYYGVLRHGCDGFLSEGSFHTYHPERHRLLNEDYCRQEGIRYARAIRAWFGDNSETKGAIMGTVKDKYKTLEHTLYKYAPNSVDAYLPLNEVTVVLKNSANKEVDRYTTDKEHNGVYVFTDLEPGTYTLVYDFPDTEYIADTAEIEVKANETSFINMLVADTTTPPPYPFLDPYYPTPEQDGDIAAPTQFEFEKELELNSIEVLQGLTVRRAILRDNKYYVLAVDATKAPKLLVINPTTGELIKEMSTEGIITEGHQGKEFPYVLSDIAFTTDGVLIGTNSTVIGRENNSYQTGDFYVYKWQATDTETLEDSKPIMITKLPTNTWASLAQSGNNYSNFIGNSIAVKGNIDDFYLYFNSHAGNDWTTEYTEKLISWKITNDELAGYQWNDTKYLAPDFGSSFRITYSPFGDIENEDQKEQLHRFVLDGNISNPIEFRVDWNSHDAIEIAQFSDKIPVESSGTNFFRYLDKVYMTTVECEKQADNTYSHKVKLYDVTNGLDNAVSIGTTEAVVTNQPEITYMASAGVVNNVDIELYLLVGDNIVKFRSKQIEPKAIARIFASDLKAEKNANGYTISYVLNENATSVELILSDAESGKNVKTIALTGLSKGENTAEIAFTDIPEGSKFNWSIKATADNITKFVKISDDSEKYHYFGPKGVAVDKSPESKFFGRVYITNSDEGSDAGRTTTKGIYILGADGSDITSQGDNAYTGNITWDNTTKGVSPRKVAVAADGRVFVSDYSHNNSGIYYMNPETYEMASIFTGATRETTYGKLSVGSTYVGGRTGAISVTGTGADTRLYGVDRSVAEGTSCWKNINTYNIGEAVEWTTAPSAAGRKASYIGNDNNSLAAVEGGYWAAQYRGSGSETTGNPFMFYYSNAENNTVFNTYTSWGKTGSSMNGAMGVNEKEKVIALAFNNGAAIFSYTMDGNTPIVSEKFISTLNGSTTAYDDFEFDYAGNMYAVSYAGKLVSVWAMPTSDNSCITPAQKSMVLENTGTGIDEIETMDISVYPNPINDYCIIESADGIEYVEVYSNTGVLLDKVNGNAAKSITIDTSRYPKGIYLIKINHKETVKVIK